MELGDPNQKKSHDYPPKPKRGWFRRQITAAVWGSSISMNRLLMVEFDSSQIRCCLLVLLSAAIALLLESRMTKLVKPGIPNPGCSLKRYFGVYAFVFQWMMSSNPNVLADFYDRSILNYISPHQIFVNGR